MGQSPGRGILHSHLFLPEDSFLSPALSYSLEYSSPSDPSQSIHGGWESGCLSDCLRVIASFEAKDFSDGLHAPLGKIPSVFCHSLSSE